MESPREAENLVVFDFDRTVIDLDSEAEIISLLRTEIPIDRTINWVDMMNKVYQNLHDQGTTIEDIKKALCNLKLNEGIRELFNFLHEHKEDFDVIIISGASYYIVETILEHYGLLGDVKKIFSVGSKFTREGMVHNYQRSTHHCPNCNPCICKTQEYTEYIKENGKSYERIFYMCDGANDMCLAKNLGERDVLFPRKDFALYKLLFPEDPTSNSTSGITITTSNDLKCGILPWNNAHEILENIKNFLHL